MSSASSDTDQGYDSMGKRSRFENFTNDIDNLLSAYTAETTEDISEEKKESFESDEKLFSPIKELLVFSEKKNTSSLLEHLQSDTNSVQSPILAKKTANLDVFKIKSNNKFVLLILMNYSLLSFF
jgi:hypothetical protein